MAIPIFAGNDHEKVLDPIYADSCPVNFKSGRSKNYPCPS